MQDNEGWTLVKNNKNKKKNNNTNSCSGSSCNANSCNANSCNVTNNDAIVFKKKQEKNTILVPKQNTNRTNPDYQRLYKIEKEIEDDSFTIEKISKKLQNDIIQNRTRLNLTRKDLAIRCNIKENVLKSYEDGLAVPPNEHLIAMSKVFGVSLKKK
ncbi:helix-turn-helix domain protein [Hokovirus HKV1]|uniref:Helix-turn-helix domain protein n=1 Tax=Hokovirus HKV1 TaxID=1977638 RepID=A0A1V0SHG4_9VIRU|nr:helix-turn-helix domain protein [Hokovirus HKV1]